VLEKRMAKNPLPGNTLPCALCRASAHGKGFAVQFSPFAVPFARTTKHCSPVVCRIGEEKTSANSYGEFETSSFQIFLVKLFFTISKVVFTSH
jgi:hypothetical protein